MRETRQFRGISKRLAAHYLENLGGEPTAEDRIEGEGWSAELSAETVDVAGSVQLTEVTVEFEGQGGTLEDLVEKFTRKAIRAGG